MALSLFTQLSGYHRIGYVRVSAFDQNPERQLEGIQVGRTFTDKVSGKDVDRKDLDAWMAYARMGGTRQIHLWK